MRLDTGDVLVFPRGDAYAMSVERRALGASNSERTLGMMRGIAEGRLPFVVSEGEPAAASLLCGFLGCDMRPFNPLLATLPRLLVVRRKDVAPDRLDQLASLTIAESRCPAPGADCVRLRLSELMFVGVVRRYLMNLPDGETGWLGGLRDPIVGRALSLLHDRPAHGWTLRELAKEAGASRSALAERFSRLIGAPPMQYLTSWRMQLAGRSLADGAEKVASVALEVGYDSEAAFSRAFKKVTGVSPAAWRDAHQASR